MDELDALQQQLMATVPGGTASTTGAPDMPTTTVSEGSLLTPEVTAGTSTLFATPGATQPAALSLALLASTPQTGSAGSGLCVIRTDSSGASSNCRHRIGKADVPGKIDKVCYLPWLQNLETCGTHHQGAEVALKPNHLYVASRKQVFMEPTIDADRLKDDFIDALLLKTASQPEWHLLFVKIDLAARWLSPPDKLGESEFDIWDREIWSPPKTTPGQRPEDPSNTPGSEVILLGTLPGGTPAGLRPARTLFLNSPDVVMFDDSSRTPLDADMTKEALNKAGKAISTLNQNSAAAHDLYAEDFRKLHGQVTALTAMVGEPVAHAPGNNPTLWGAIADLEATNPPLAVDSVSAKTFKETVDPMQIAVTSNESQISSLSKESLDLKAELITLQNEIKRLTAHVGSSYTMLADLKSRPVVQHVLPPPAAPDAAQAGLNSDVLKDLCSQMSTLVTDVRTLKAHQTSTGVISVFPDHLSDVQTLDDMLAWVKLNFRTDQAGGGNLPDPSDWLGERQGEGSGSPTFGPFVDYGGLLAIAEDLGSNLSKMEILKEKEQLIKTDIKQRTELFFSNAGLSSPCLITSPIVTLCQVVEHLTGQVESGCGHDTLGLFYGGKAKSLSEIAVYCTLVSPLLTELSWYTSLDGPRLHTRSSSTGS